MFIYMSKKVLYPKQQFKCQYELKVNIILIFVSQIAIPKQSNVNCISWNHATGYIAVGGEDGMLKVLKLESGRYIFLIQPSSLCKIL